MLSRVADSLYWLSRYLERAEHTARLTDVCLNRMLEMDGSPDDERWNLLLASLRVSGPTHIQGDIYGRIHALIFDSEWQSSLAHSLALARENARQVREQISSEMWEQLNELYLYVRGSSTDKRWETQPHEFAKAIKEGSQLFQGITDSTMSHAEGWHFIQVGRFIERAFGVSSILDVHYKTFMRGKDDCVAPGDYSDWVCLLKSCTAFEAYCKVYTANLRPDSIAEFLLLNAQFPHAICFAIETIQSSLLAIASFTRTPKSSRVNRLVGRLVATLNFGQIEEIMSEGVDSYLEEIQAHCTRIHIAFYQSFISYEIDGTRLRSAS